MKTNDTNNKIFYPELSYKITGCAHDVTEPGQLSDIIGPSNKKIKVVFDCVSIYAFGLTN